MNPLANKVADSSLPLQRMYRWEKERAHHVYMTQPMGGGVSRDYTWAQTLAEARSMAAYLKSFGWPPGSCIAILSKNCAHWIMSDFAIWMAGYVSVPLYPTLTAASVRQILEHSEAKALFVGKLDEWPQMQPGVPAGLPCISYPLSPKNDFPTWDTIVASTPPLAESPVRAGSELATIIYTSGTTGIPKGVMHPFSSFSTGAEIIGKGFGVGPDERALSYLPLSHVAERAFIEAASVFNGFHIFFAESLDTFARDLRNARPTVFMSVPRLWVKFQQGVFAKIPKKKLDVLFRIPVLGRIVRRKILDGIGLGEVRSAFGGAAPMPASLISWYRDLGLELLEVYGMTENFGCSHGSFPGQGRVGYVGSTWPGVECRLSPSGEVQTRGDTTMIGYYKEPQKTAETLSADGWLSTGDLGEFDEQGRLKITGRAKELFKTSKGKYVAPAPIENRLTAHSKVEAVCVTGVNFAQPFAVVMLPLDVAKAAQEPAQRTELSASFAQHLATVNAALDAHEQLDFIAVVSEQWTVENGFITPTMKIKRNVLEKHYEPHFERWLGTGQPVVWHDAA